METIEKLRTSLQTGNAFEGARIVLTCMIFIGFVISGIVEHGVTVALSPSELSLEMSRLKMPEDNVTRPRRYCDPPNMTALAMYYDSSEETDMDENYDFSQLQEMFFQAELSPQEKMELLLKKFYLWGTLFSPIPASRLAVNIGPKKIFGYALLGAAASTLLVPAAWMTPAHVVIRFFQGLFCGALIPSAHSLAINWFPSFRRSSFVSLYSGKYIGYALCELFTVKMVYFFGPGSIYFLTSMLVIVWFVPWSMIVFSTPDKHLKYSRCEKSSINLASSTPMAKDFPIKSFVCSRPLWMCIAAIFGAYCGQVSINVGMRLYLKYVYNVSDGFFSAIPYVLHVVFALSCGYLVSYIEQTQFVSVTSSRRMFVYISHFIPAGFLFVIGFVGCGTAAPVLLYGLTITVSGAIYSGAFVSALDIAPNYAGTIMAFGCTFGSSGSILMVHLISSVLHGEVLGSWRLTFSLTSLILLLTAILFMLRGSGRIQSWNDPNFTDLEAERAVKSDDKNPRHSIIAPLPSKPRTKSIYTVEKKILKVLHVQEPDKFTRVRAYSTSLPNETQERPNTYRPTYKKRASIS